MKRDFTQWSGTALLVVISLIWGSSYLFMKKGLIAFTPVEMASIRLAFTSFCFLPIFLVHKNSIKPHHWKYLLIIAITGSGAPAFLYAIGQTGITSSVAGILGALNPIFTILVGVTLYGLRINTEKYLGIGIGFLGAFILIISGPNGLDFSSQNLGMSFLVVLAVFCYAFSSNTIQKYLPTMNPLAISSGAFFLLLFPNLAEAVHVGVLQESFWTTARKEVIIFILLLAFLGTFLANILYFHLVQKNGAVMAATVSYLIPIVSILLGVLDGEKLSEWQILGMVTILVGVYLSRK